VQVESVRLTYREGAPNYRTRQSGENVSKVQRSFFCRTRTKKQIQKQANVGEELAYVGKGKGPWAREKDRPWVV